MSEELFIQASLRFLTIPYKWGGQFPTGYDCSGLVQHLLAMLGLDPPGDQTAQALYNHFVNTSVRAKKKTGTLYFYGTSLTKITHVALGIGPDSIIEAGGGGSRTTSVDAAEKAEAFVRLRPNNHRRDLLITLNPSGLPW